MYLAHGRHSKDISLDSAQERVQSTSVLQTEFVSNASSPPMTTSRKRDSVAPLLMMESDLTPDTTEEPTIYVYELDMFVQVQVLKESPAVLSLGNLCSQNGYSYEWHPGQSHHISSRMRENRV